MKARSSSVLFSKQAILTGILGICLGLSFFLAVNPEYRNGLLSDISGTIPMQGNVGDIGYLTTTSRLTIASNLDLEGIESITILLNNNPETEVLLKTPKSESATIEKMGPSMNKYIFPIKILKKGQTIAVFSHNGNKEDISVGDVKLLFEDKKENGLSVTNLN